MNEAVLFSGAVTGLVDAWESCAAQCSGREDISLTVWDMSDAELLTLARAAGEVAKRAEVLGAVVAGEIARRSPVEARLEGFAKRAGYPSPGRMVADLRGGRVGRAVELIRVGQGTAARRSLTGEVLPARYPQLAAALHSNQISVDKAHLIISMLERVTPRAMPEDLERAEELLASQARQFPLPQLDKLVRHAEAHLDADGMEPREEQQHANRSLVVREDSSGMVHLRGSFDPVTGAPIKLALQAYAQARMRQARGCNAPDQPEAYALAETRTIPQLQADALADFIAHIRGCPDTQTVMPQTTMVVRINLKDLQGSTNGVATIDGISQPISAAAARRLAAAAHLIPAVFGNESLPLDLGRASRAFSRSQTLALWERDGGCAFCGQTTFIEAHHIRWWHRHQGRTDLRNGILLCTRCHHLIHRQHWDIEITGKPKRVWFIPPASIDPERTPRPAAPHPGQAEWQAAPSHRQGECSAAPSDGQTEWQAAPDPERFGKKISPQQTQLSPLRPAARHRARAARPPARAAPGKGGAGEDLKDCRAI